MQPGNEGQKELIDELKRRIDLGHDLIESRSTNRRENLYQARDIFNGVLKDAPSDPELQAMAKNGLGRACLELEALGQAEEVLKNALEVCPKDKDDLRSAILQNLGCTLGERGDLHSTKEASGYLEEAYGLRIKSKNNLSNLWKAETLGELGNVSLRRRTEDALVDADEHYQEAARLFASCGEESRRLDCIRNRAIVYRRLPKNCQENLRCATDLLEDELCRINLVTSGHDFVKFQHGLANIYRDRALLKDTPSEKRKQYCQKAKEAYQLVLTLLKEEDDPTLYVRARLNLGKLLRRYICYMEVGDRENGWKDAKDTLLDALKTAENQKSCMLPNVRGELGELYKDAKRWNEAKDCYLLAIEELDVVRKAYRISPEGYLELSEDISHWYRSLGECDDRLGDYKSAVETFDYGKAMYLSTLLIGRNAFANPAMLSLDDMQALIPDSQTALVELRILGEQALIYIITKDGFCRLQLPGRGAPWFLPLVNNWVQKYDDHKKLRQDEPGYKDLRNSWFDTIRDSLARLYGEFLEKLHEQLQTSKIRRVVFISHRALDLLPLHAAFHESNGEQVYFMDDYDEISYVPNARTFQQCRARVQNKQQTGTLLALAHPHFKKEVDVISQLSYWNTRYTFENATVAKVKEHCKEAEFVHFSCHGMFDQYVPLQSRLYLGKEELTLAGILQDRFELPCARLVVLSACETGMTNFIDTSDEYVGLPAGFLSSGASAVIASLWKVDSLATLLLFEKFYQNIFQQKTPATAIKEAQNWVRIATAEDVRQHLQDLLHKEYYKDLEREYKLDEQYPFSHPYFWAAWHVIGC